MGGSTNKGTILHAGVIDKTKNRHGILAKVRTAHPRAAEKGETASLCLEAVVCKALASVVARALVPAISVLESGLEEPTILAVGQNKWCVW